jgi:hypothetical protein
MKKFFILISTLFIFLASNAQIIRSYSTVVPPGGPFINESGSFSQFNTTNGTASSPQNITFLGTGLTNPVTVSVGSGIEVSKDGITFSTSLTYTGGATISGTITARIPASATNGNYPGFVTIASVGAASVNVPYTAVVGASPFMSVSTNTITNLNSSIGSAGTAQTFVVTFGNLSGNLTVTTFSPVEISQDGGSTWSSTTQVFSTGSPKTISARVASTASAGPVSGTIQVTGPGVTQQNVTVTGTVSAALAALFNFSASANTVAGATNVFGDPTLSPSFTNSTTGWTLAVRGANWVKFGGTNYGGVGNGATVASSDGTFTQPQIGSNLYNIGSYSTGTQQLEFTNLPTGTYAITLLGSIPTSVFPNSGNMEFHVVFASGTDNYSYFDPNGAGSTGNITSSGPNAVTSGSFTGAITSGQTIKIWVVKGTAGGNTGALGYINGLKIVKTN